MDKQEQINQEAIKEATDMRSLIPHIFNVEKPYPTHAFTRDYLDTGTLWEDVKYRRSKKICVMCGIETKYELKGNSIRLKSRKEHEGSLDNNSDVCNECTARMLSGQPRKKVSNYQDKLDEINEKNKMGFLLMRSGV